MLDRGDAPTGRRCATSPAQAQPRVWYARLDVEESWPTSSSQLTAEPQRADARPAWRRPGRATACRRSPAHRRSSTASRGSVSDPPLVVPVEDLFRDWSVDEIYAEIAALIRVLPAHPAADRRASCSSSSSLVQVARKVVGVGSVGTRAWILLLRGRRRRDPLFLQAKEAAAVGARGLRRREPRSPSRSAGRRGAAAHAGVQRHLPRLAAQSSGSTARPATSTSGSCATGRGRSSSSRWSPTACGSTRACAAGRWPARMPAPVTGSRSRRTSAAATLRPGGRRLRGRVRRPDERDHAALGAAVEAGRVEATPGV